MSGVIERVLTSKEVAELERISTHAVTAACAAGEFEGAYRVGDRGPWRIPESAVVERRRRLTARAEEELARSEASRLRLEDFGVFTGAVAPLSPRSRKRRRLGA